MDNRTYTLEFEKPLRDLGRQLEALHQQSLESQVDLGREIASIEQKIEATRHEVYSSLTPWQRVQIARHPARPYALDYVNLLFTRFIEFHGDRQFGDDRALIGGTAFFGKTPVMIIAQQKGRELKEKTSRNFGMPQPEGYRKALRLMRLAERFELPIVTFVDTPGAYPGIGSEERHVSEAIATNLREMTLLKVPTVSVVVGEGGSGGALGIGITDRVLCFENSYYSVISPEGCAAILWKDTAEAPQAASALRLNSATLREFGVVDEVLSEPEGGAHNNPEQAAKNLGESLKKHLEALLKLDTEQLLETRYARYRKLGVYNQSAVSK
jgi:acetyl-CoA carboxylase carboxyl transferase subunit alpha